MFADGHECQVAASHQYVTAKREKIFPEYVDSANKSGFLVASSQSLRISSQGTEIGLWRWGDHGEALPSNDWLKGLVLHGTRRIGRFPSPPISNLALIRTGCLLGSQTLFAIPFPLNFMQQFTETLASPVQLRLRDAFRASQHFRDFPMLVPLDIVQDKYCARARWQLRDAAAKIDSINRPLQQQVGSGEFDARRGGFTIRRGTRFHREHR